MKVRVHVIFEGLVQGVFFRANTKKCADTLGVTGWVRNMHDGRVEALFEGDEKTVLEVVDWCATRQPYAKVDSRTIEVSEFKGEFAEFEVRY